MRTKPEDYAGSGSGGDWLIPLRQRPQIALSKSIIAILAAYGVEIPISGTIDPTEAQTLPLVVLTALAKAGLIGKPKVVGG